MGKTIQGEIRMKLLVIGVDGLDERRLNDMKYFKYAWAITIHKAQGKEWDKVVVILPSENMCMMNNSILYTAITRSKKECILISDHTTLKRSISIDYKKPNTMLSIKN